MEIRSINGKDANGTKTRNSQSYTMERVKPILPRSMEYDIINPGPRDNALRMSSYGKNVLSSRQQQRTKKIQASSPAGSKIVARDGEANIDEIWPIDSHLRPGYNERNRGLDTSDINRNIYNVRQAKIRQMDTQKIEAYLKSKEKPVEAGHKPYKNASNVFVHLVDNPNDR